MKIELSSLDKSKDLLFWAKVKENLTTGCWEWQAHKSKFGYGRVRRNRFDYVAHRYLYELYIGPIPQDKILLHDCDNPACVNLNHLFLGTYQDNSDDMVTKQRCANRKGELAGGAILKEETVKIFLALHPEISIRNLSNLFKVSYQAVYDVISKRRWKHISISQEEKISIREKWSAQYT